MALLNTPTPAYVGAGGTAPRQSTGGGGLGSLLTAFLGGQQTPSYLGDAQPVPQNSSGFFGLFPPAPVYVAASPEPSDEPAGPASPRPTGDEGN